MDKNKAFMAEALKEAALAAEMGEVPIGAVIVRGDEIIAAAHNLVETSKYPTAHAEMLAIRQAATRLGGWRLTGCHMYVTVEPCSMCAGAIVWARIEKLFIGTDDPKGGACGSIFNIPQEKKLNHYTEIETGLLREECSEIMKTFFKKLRDRKSEDNQ
ncbi:MAG: nucleoside deaminase [Lentihominibacter sp.]|nr:nucleoside deaminase [Lentihominibacter sp.]